MPPRTTHSTSAEAHQVMPIDIITHFLPILHKLSTQRKKAANMTKKSTAFPTVLANSYIREVALLNNKSTRIIPRFTINNSYSLQQAKYSCNKVALQQASNQLHTKSHQTTQLLTGRTKRSRDGRVVHEQNVKELHRTFKVAAMRHHYLRRSHELEH